MWNPILEAEPAWLWNSRIRKGTESGLNFGRSVTWLPYMYLIDIYSNAFVFISWVRPGKASQAKPDREWTSRSKKQFRINGRRAPGFHWLYTKHSGAERSPGQTKYIIGGSYIVGNVCAVRFRNSWRKNMALGCFGILEKYGLFGVFLATLHNFGVLEMMIQHMV